MSTTMNISGIDFKVIGARRHFVEAFGREPIDDDEALDNDMEAVKILSARRTVKASV